eukprot:TRINITY_DN22803_c0_g1_i1.p1 TRINITY_DN22803_c0_g1~~TRINITY_DN22803_c0_g1_i1.p1  ORF type:complete len:774 (+),score=201.26 TRINITY_DN22803_c0_g1_i1:78-2399(+)
MSDDEETPREPRYIKSEVRERDVPNKESSNKRARSRSRSRDRNSKRKSRSDRRSPSPVEDRSRNRDKDRNREDDRRRDRESDRDRNNRDRERDDDRDRPSRDRRDDRNDRRDDRRDERRDDRDDRRDDRRRRDDSSERSARSPPRRSGQNGTVRDGPSKDGPAADSSAAPAAPAKETKTGGVYIPPFKLAMMQKEIQDKSSPEYQRMTWEALKKSINGIINKVSIANIKNLIPELFYENLIRGRGLFCRSIMKAQQASQAFTNVYAALVSVVNTKMPELGELLIIRLIIQLRKAFRRNNKPICLASTNFLAHLANQQVVGVIVPLQIASLLLEKPTEDSVEVAVSFLTECGALLSELSPQGFNGIFESFRNILSEGTIDKRVQYTIEGLFAVRKTGFKEHQAVIDALDLVELEDQITHEDVSLDDTLDPQDQLHFFHVDPKYSENEDAYRAIRLDILGDDVIDEIEGRAEDRPPGESDEEEEEEGSDAETGGIAAASGAAGNKTIQDKTETDLVNLRRTIYLTIMSSLDFNECAHKLLKINLGGHEIELANMILECCSQERTYMRFYGLLGARFCLLKKEYAAVFDHSFAEQYSTIHRLETNKLRNVAKFFAHLLHSDALSWSCLEYIRLNETDTTSSSRIFIKILFQEMAEFLGLPKLNERLKDSTMQQHFEGLMPRDNPKNTRFAINFFTSIGLGGLTDGLREHLRNAPKQIMQAPESDLSSSDSDSDSDSSDSDSSDSSDSDSSDSSDSSSSSSSSSDSDRDRRKRRGRR